MQADTLLSASLTFHEACLRTEKVPLKFDNVAAVFETMRLVLLHEARESVRQPTACTTGSLQFLTVDVDTPQPGIFDKDETLLRKASDDIVRLSYAPASATRRAPDGGAARRRRSRSPCRTRSRRRTRAKRRAPRRRPRPRSGRRAGRSASGRGSRRRRRSARRGWKRQGTAEEAQGEEQQEEEEARAAPPPEEEEEEEEAPPPPPPLSKKEEAPPPAADEADPELLVVGNARPSDHGRKRKPQIAVNAAPHHRHLYGLTRAALELHDGIAQALLRGVASDAVLLIDGPPGTGKTTQLVERLPAEGRVLLAAASNVAATNLYERCLQAGYDDVSLVLPRERVPLGTAVLSNDPGARIVCATISGRNGPRLDDEAFEHVFVDEAAQTMEAWIWTLMRADVRSLTLAGDVRQLPAVVSSSGQALSHQRSIMERLLALKYERVVSLTTQNRMAPQLLAYPNAEFYGSTLTTGPAAPADGFIKFHPAVNAREEKVETSYRSTAEAEMCLRVLKAVQKAGENDAVILVPYVAQMTEIVSRSKDAASRTCTLDGFQGREADVVILSLVRDGTAGFGFWDDDRRLNVALTRARRQLHVILSPAASEWNRATPLGRFVGHFLKF